MYEAECSPEAAASSREHALIDRVVHRDAQALAELYDHFYALVFAIAVRITGDRAVAEEVVQDVFFGVWRTAGSFQRGCSVAGWIIGIARHRAIDATRASTFHARMRELQLAPSLELVTGVEPEEHVERQLVGAQVRAALDGLAPAQRQALELAYYGGLSQVEIAARMHAPVGTTKTRLRLGLLHLRRELAHEQPRNV